MPAHLSSGRAADQVVSAIEERINAGQLTSGTPLPPERDLMEQYGISRTVVREAVRQLSARGLIDARPRHRPVVRPPSFDTALDVMGGIVRQLLNQKGGIKNLFDTRMMIEVFLVREAALKATRDDIAALAAALQANEAAIEDSERFYQTDVAFHRVLYDIPRNPVLLAVQKSYIEWLGPHWSAMERLPDRNRHNFESHRAIYDAILMRDPDEAEKMMRSHLADAWRQVRKTFGDL